MRGQLVTREALTARQTFEMRRLLDASFEGVDEAGFTADLQDKNWVILLHDTRGVLVGFSTLRLYFDQVDDAPCTIVYSGDTIVTPAARGSTALARTWIRSVRRLHDQHGHDRLFWLLISSGYRTYRFLPVFFRAFYPRFDHTPVPADTQVHRLAHDRFGSQYDARTGIVRMDRPQRLRPHLLDLSPGRLNDPHIAYFLERNPGHAHGDELVCFTSLEDANLTPAGIRMLHGHTERRPATLIKP